MQFPIDLEQYDRREQLKRSGIGKVIDNYDDILLVDTISEFSWGFYQF